MIFYACGEQGRCLSALSHQYPAVVYHSPRDSTLTAAGIFAEWYFLVLEVYRKCHTLCKRKKAQGAPLNMYLILQYLLICNIYGSEECEWYKQVSCLMQTKKSIRHATGRVFYFGQFLNICGIYGSDVIGSYEPVSCPLQTKKSSGHATTPIF